MLCESLDDFLGSLMHADFAGRGIAASFRTPNIIKQSDHLLSHFYYASLLSIILIHGDQEESLSSNDTKLRPFLVNTT